MAHGAWLLVHDVLRIVYNVCRMMYYARYIAHCFAWLLVHDVLRMVYSVCRMMYYARYIAHVVLRMAHGLWCQAVVV